jgi:hypothetical protein
MDFFFVDVPALFEPLEAGNPDGQEAADVSRRTFSL